MNHRAAHNALNPLVSESRRRFAAPASPIAACLQASWFTSKDIDSPQPHASDTFESGTIAAAWGGVTTIVDFAVQAQGTTVQDGLATWHEKADGNCAIDYGFHQIIGGVDEDSLKAMTYLAENEGITSFKLFMAYPGVFYSDDGQILRLGHRNRQRVANSEQGNRKAGIRK